MLIGFAAAWSAKQMFACEHEQGITRRELMFSGAKGW
jgi:hypothetical protein